VATPLALEYGRQPYLARLPEGSRVLRAPTPAEPAPPATRLLEAALDLPIAAAPLELAASGARRVLVVVSDRTRREPRHALLAAVFGRLPEAASVTVAIANGTHAPGDPAALGIGDQLWRRVDAIVNHDGARAGDMVRFGTTCRGTPVLAHRALCEADLVIATGCIIPHYFAGYGAGIKSIFPGLGETGSVRHNHQLKREPASRAGVTDGNPCREDLEEVAAMLPARPYLLNAVLDDDGAARAAVAGDVVTAFRAGAAMCRPLFEVRARPNRLVVVSGRLPITATLYQASKLVAAAAPLVAPGGTVVVVAECADGVGPVDVVNRGIYEIGLRPRLPPDHRILLVSSLGREQVAATYCEWAPSLEDALSAAPGPPLVLPRASSLLCRPV
jgi:nickel-dependent lactate racemase